MAGLQRSAVSFRRQGSSGLIWEDRFFSGDLNQMKKEQEGAEFRELRPSQSVGSIPMMQRNRSVGGGRASHTCKVSPAIDPPSPKVSVCGCCGAFKKPAPAQQPNFSNR